MTSENNPAQSALDLYSAISRNPKSFPERFDEFNRQPVEVLVLLVAWLTVAHEVTRFVAPVQSIIDRRLHAEQLESQTGLRQTMEKVSTTLLAVEKNQRRIEYIGLFVGTVGSLLAAIQVWIAIRNVF